jgi:tRNA threonylcarbamoyladenosine biosynthesis protein TsaE
MRWVSHSVEETIEQGKWFASSLRPGDIVALSGTLGTGKTQFAIGICRGLGIEHGVLSPSFTIINEYEGEDFDVAHIDLYRLEGKEEVAMLGLEEYLDSLAVCLIEWPEKDPAILRDDTWRVFFEHGSVENERLITVTAPDR